MNILNARFKVTGTPQWIFTEASPGVNSNTEPLPVMSNEVGVTFVTWEKLPESKIDDNMNSPKYQDILSQKLFAIAMKIRLGSKLWKPVVHTEEGRAHAQT